MKKIVSLLLTAVMLCALLAVPAFAVGSITVSSASAKQGQTVTLNVGISGNPGLVTLGITVNYDTNVLQLTGVTDTHLLGGNPPLSSTYNTGYKISWLDYNATTDNTANGTIATLTFKVKDNAAVGTTTVSVAVNSSYKTDMTTKNSISGGSGTIKVECSTHSFGGWSQTSAPGCTSPGQEKRTCNACGTPETRAVSATGHNWSAWSQTSAPGCTTPGQEKRTCSACGTPETRSITATGHSFGGWSQSKAPGCTTAGEQKRSCSACGTPETRTIAATGHKFSNPTVTKAPTCTSTGTETGKCTDCGQSTSNTIAALGHSYGKWTTDKAATCTETGTQKRTCSTCGDAVTRTVAALGHDFEDPTVVKEATISTPGLMEGKCKNCGEATQQTIPCGAADAATGIAVEAEEGVFAEGTQTAFSAVTASDAGYEGVKNAVADFGGNFEAYSITFTPAPTGTYTLTLPNSGNLAEEDMTVVLVVADGTAAEVAFTLDADGNIAVSTAETGTFAVIDKSAGNAVDTDTDEPPVENEPSSGSTIWIWIVIGVAVAAAVAVTLLLVLKKKPQE